MSIFKILLITSAFILSAPFPYLSIPKSFPSLSIHFPFTFHIRTAPDTWGAASDSAACCRWGTASEYWACCRWCTASQYVFLGWFAVSFQTAVQSLWFRSPQSHGQSQYVAVSFILGGITGESARILWPNEYRTYPLQIESIGLIEGAVHVVSMIMCVMNWWMICILIWCFVSCVYGVEVAGHCISVVSYYPFGRQERFT